MEWLVVGVFLRFNNWNKNCLSFYFLLQLIYGFFMFFFALQFDFVLLLFLYSDFWFLNCNFWILDFRLILLLAIIDDSLYTWLLYRLCGYEYKSVLKKLSCVLYLCSRGLLLKLIAVAISIYLWLFKFCSKISTIV